MSRALSSDAIGEAWIASRDALPQTSRQVRFVAKVRTMDYGGAEKRPSRKIPKPRAIVAGPLAVRAAEARELQRVLNRAAEKAALIFGTGPKNESNRIASPVVVVRIAGFLPYYPPEPVAQDFPRRPPRQILGRLRLARAKRGVPSGVADHESRVMAQLATHCGPFRGAEALPFERVIHL